jgi:hypothetical protein
LHRLSFHIIFCLTLTADSVYGSGRLLDLRKFFFSAALRRLARAN